MPTVIGANKAEFDKAEMERKGELKKSYLDTTGLPNKGRDLIQGEAEKFAKRLREQGFQVGIDHSGSKAGPSSYVTIHDPQTQRFIRDPIRFSNHSKGVFNNQFVHPVHSLDDLDKYEKMAQDMRKEGPSQTMQPLDDITKAKVERLRAKNLTRQSTKEAV